MPHHYSTEKPDDLRPKPKHQGRQHQKAHEPSQENRHQEVAKAHFKHGRAQHEDFEGSRWREHPRKHQRPEFVLLKRAMDLQKALLRNPLAQYFFASQVTHDVQRNAAQRRTQRRHRDVDQKPRVVFIHVPGNDKIYRHAQQGTVGEGNHKRAPDPKHLHQAQDPSRIARQYVSDALQGKA